MFVKIISHNVFKNLKLFFKQRYSLKYLNLIFTLQSYLVISWKALAT